ncbi:hypothetical protein CFter6_1312 [Collimonas fungivorans]|uniref:Uncharacterized protein n=1 Tax=Collimonas fungivorans TaxID=158899 RepID=A0A127P8Q5_9BURK|nr:hypothetical protein CFter6_1312 [Collimonas fungivorans]
MVLLKIDRRRLLSESTSQKSQYQQFSPRRMSSSYWQGCVVSVSIGVI